MEQPAESNADQIAAGQGAEEATVASNEEERLWGIVNANPAEFNSWTQLIQETEKLNDIGKLRQCYDTFLAEFPLCYGYWKKYADHEQGPDKKIEVYERAVKAVTYSVDIWFHYCSYVSSAKPEDPEGLRRLFERGLSYVGMDYLAHPLWDKYIEFEYSHQNWVGITQLYTRILQNPLSVLERYFLHFKELANNRPLAELRGPEEITSVVDPNDEPEAEDAAAPKDPEVRSFIRVREAMYKATKEWDSKIKEYEAAIRRPYFHVKPLDDGQLLNWHRYLDFLEKEADFERLRRTYERCVIACANYPEYWIRFIQAMEERGNRELADDALHRATQTFVKRRQEIHLYAAHFHERRGDLAGARREYNLLSSEVAPGLLEAISKHANFEKRQGNISAACAVYESMLEVEKAKDDSRILPFLYVQYLRFLNMAGLSDKVKLIQAVALEKLPFSKTVIEAVIHYEALSREKDIQKLDAIVEKASGAQSSLTAADREEISTVFLEFLEAHGTPEQIGKATARHRQCFVYSRTSDSKKRPSLDAQGADRSKQLKAAGTPYAGYPNGWTYQQWQQQWSQGYQGYNYGYGQYPQQQQGYTAYPQGYSQQDGNWTAAATW